MLKYEINTGSMSEDKVELELNSVSSHDYYADDSKIVVRNVWTNDMLLYEGEEVEILTTWDKDDGFGGRVPIMYQDNVVVEHCDNTDQVFSFVADKNIELLLNSIFIEVEDNNMYIHFTFDSWHCFRTWDSYGISIIIRYMNSDESYSLITFRACQFVSEMELKWKYDAGLLGIDNFMCRIFRNDKYEFVGLSDEQPEDKYVQVNKIPETACFTDELYLCKHIIYRKEPPCEKWELYEKSCNEGTLYNVSCFRENFKFNDVNITREYVTIPLTSVALPLSIKTGYDLYNEMNYNEKLVNEEVEKGKNKFVEMEKCVYHPVFRVEGEYKPVHKIKFNLHFRERFEDGWIVKNDGYWNGMDRNGLHGNVGETGVKQFFSYNDKGRQSDLLYYLGFNNTDIKYQKARLKKSFLRLSFYDSMNRANQNLLYYSTIFIDGNKLFAKMMRGAKRKVMRDGKKEGLYVVSDQANSVKYEDAKVNTEPFFEVQTSDDTKEEYRLSSQITVSDRFSDSCSEGFYLYLWADNDNGAVPSDIYMRVEFNHAGYGRVIPFTMPYMEGSRIYSFHDISDAWLVGNQNGTLGWGVKKNELFSYVHFKYAYDRNSKQHVYFLDDETYGLSSYYDDTSDELELNLYEAKINFENY